MVGAWTRRAVVLAGTVAVLPAAAQARPPTVNGVVIGRDGWLFQQSGEPGNVWVRAVDEAVCDLAAEAASLVRAAGITPVLVLIPAKNRVHRAQLGPAPSPPDFLRRYAFLLERLRRGGALAPDLDGAFRRALAERPAENLFFRADTHWTPRGAEVAAEAVAALVREGAGLPPPPAPGARLGPPQTQTLGAGDLQRLLPPDHRAGLGPEEFRIRPAVAAGGLLDDAPGDVAAVGSSFLEGRYGYGPALSHALGRPAQLAWRPNTVGPWATLLEYLRSGEFRRHRPRLLAWHHLELDMANGPSAGGWGRHGMTAAAFLEEARRLLAA